MKNSKIAIVIMILALIGVVVWYFFSRTEIKTTEEALDAISTTQPATIETNPIKKVPDLNPVEKINPFKTSNPFE